MQISTFVLGVIFSFAFAVLFYAVYHELCITRKQKLQSQVDQYSIKRRMANLDAEFEAD